MGITSSPWYEQLVNMRGRWLMLLSVIALRLATVAISATLAALTTGFVTKLDPSNDTTDSGNAQNRQKVRDAVSLFFGTTFDNFAILILALSATGLIAYIFSPHTAERLGSKNETPHGRAMKKVTVVVDHLMCGLILYFSLGLAVSRELFPAAALQHYNGVDTYSDSTSFIKTSQILSWVLFGVSCVAVLLDMHVLFKARPPAK